MVAALRATLLLTVGGAAAAEVEMAPPDDVPWRPLPPVGVQVLLIVFLAGAVGLFASVLARQRARLSVMVGCGSGAMLLVVGLTAWAIAVRGLQPTIEERTAQLIYRAAELAQAHIAADFKLGADILSSLSLRYLLSAGGLPTTYPEAHLELAQPFISFGEPPSIALIYYATGASSDPRHRDGARLFGVGHSFREEIRNTSTYIGMFGTFIPGEPVPEYLTCTAYDRNVSLPHDSGEPYIPCATYTCGDDLMNDLVCQGTCARRATASGVGVDAYPAASPAYCMNLDGEPRRLQDWEARFDMAAEGLLTRSDVHPTPVYSTGKPVEYDPMSRPWWTNSTKILYSEPYLFIGGAVTVGVTLSAGAYNSDGRFIGCIAVDFTLRSVQPALAALRPTPHSEMYVADLDGFLIGTSMTNEQLSRDTGIDVDADVVSVYAIPRTRESSVYRTFAALARHFDADGAWLFAAWQRRRTVLRSDDVLYVAVPVASTVVRYLVVLSLPYSDAMGSHDEASMMTLTVTIAVAVFASVLLYTSVHVLLVPLGQLGGDMGRVAEMDLEIPAPKHSRVAEVASMQTFFRMMVNQLRQYRAFLPAQLLQTAETTTSIARDGSFVSSRLAVVFTDIKGSTWLWDQCHDGMSVALSLHNRLIRARIAQFEGYEVKTIGDAFMVVFPQAEAACLFALAIHEDLFGAEWPEGILALEPTRADADGAWRGLRIRVGVHYGDVEAVTSGGSVDYFGPVVNIAARVEGQCVPGGVCVTGTVLSEVKLPDLGDPELVCMGPRPLKGVSDPVELTILVPSALSQRVSHIRNTLDGDFKPKEVRDIIMPPQPAHSVASEDTRPSTLDARRSSGTSVGSADEGYSSRMSGSAHMRRATFSVNPMARVQDGLQERNEVVGKATIQVSGHAPMAGGLDLVIGALEALFDALERSRGSVCCVYGMGVVTRWLGLPSVAGAMRHAFHCVQMLKSYEDDARTFGETFTYAVGIASGVVLSGNVASTTGQRFATAMGPAMAVVDMLAESAVALKTCGLYASCDKSTPALIYPKLRRLIRPVDDWPCISQAGRGSVPIYEVWSGEDEPTGAAWSEEYWEAVRERKGACLPDVSGDDVLEQVRRMLMEGRRLRDCCLCLPAVSIMNRSTDAGTKNPLHGRLLGRSLLVTDALAAFDEEDTQSVV